jgi:hypothetical protein
MSVQLKYVVSLQHPGFVNAAHNPEHTLVSREAAEKLLHSPPGEPEDEVADETAAMGQRLQPLIDAFEDDVPSFAAAVTAFEQEVAVAFVADSVHESSTEEVEGDDSHPAPITMRSKLPLPHSELFGASSPDCLIPRDVQFNYLRSWCLRGNSDLPAEDRRNEAMFTLLDLSQRCAVARNLATLTLTNYGLETMHVWLLASRVLSASCSSIRRLHLSRCGLTGASIIPLARHLDGNRVITDLDVSYNCLDEVACTALEHALPKSVVHKLSVRGNSICSDRHSTALLYLLLGNSVTSVDFGFTGLADNSIVKLCTVLKIAESRVTSLNLDGADISQRVVLLLLDTVGQSRKVTHLSVEHVANCTSAQFKGKLRAALDRNQKLADLLTRGELLTPVAKGPAGLHRHKSSLRSVKVDVGAVTTMYIPAHRRSTTILF